jgi:homogentisate 1,2-dioxygenase
VICSFCPRELDYDPAAVPLPYHHSNVHSEKIIYLDDPSYAYSWRTGEPAPVAQSTTG